jgi:hypothetical protein
MDREISKQEFKDLFFRYGVAQPSSGWTESYWATFHENEERARYFFTEPASADQTRMFVSSGHGTHRIFLLSEDAEESLFER